MKDITYTCPKHSDIILCKDREAENLTERAEKMFANSILFKSFFMAELVSIYTVGPGIGPFKCKKCNKHYFKWECKKHED